MGAQFTCLIIFHRYISLHSMWTEKLSHSTNSCKKDFQIFYFLQFNLILSQDSIPLGGQNRIFSNSQFSCMELIWIPWDYVEQRCGMDGAWVWRLVLRWLRCVMSHMVLSHCSMEISDDLSWLSLQPLKVLGLSLLCLCHSPTQGLLCHAGVWERPSKLSQLHFFVPPHSYSSFILLVLSDTVKF